MRFSKVTTTAREQNEEDLFSPGLSLTRRD